MNLAMKIMKKKMKEFRDLLKFRKPKMLPRNN